MEWYKQGNPLQQAQQMIQNEATVSPSILKKIYHSVSARLLMNSSTTCPNHLMFAL